MAGVFTFDEQLRLLFRSDQLGPMLGISASMMSGSTTVLELLEGSEALDGAAVQRVHELCLAAGKDDPMHRTTLESGSGPARRSFAVAVACLEDRTVMAAFEDVTSRREAEQRAVELAMTDPLTGLANRQLFKSRVAAVLDRAGDNSANATASHALLLADLDRFKTINDTLGHSIGDGLLKLVGKRLRSIVRSHDVVARLGGDEFAIFVSPAPEQNILFDFAHRIVEMLGRPYLIEGHLVTVGASVGIACAPDDALEHEDLLRCADLALYEAKGSGRSQYVAFRPAMDAKAVARRTLEIDLRKALAMRQFELFYQPQIELGTKTVTGFEALIRWRHPERGLVSPADFIPLAEEIGMIVPLGEWVMREACFAASRWSMDLCISVNVSPLQFEDTDRLIGTVKRVLAETGLPGNRLELEITESVLLRNEAMVLTTLHKLREQGVRVAMDDFGTGYSSLSQLQSFPFDKIKIDRSFVRDRGVDTGQDAIIRAITALGDTLSMATIAEGVETPAELDRIRAGGCGSVQGYLFSRPVPTAEIERIISEFGVKQPGLIVPALT